MFPEQWMSICFIHSNYLNDTIACREGSLCSLGNHSKFWATEQLFGDRCVPFPNTYPATCTQRRRWLVRVISQWHMPAPPLVWVRRCIWCQKQKRNCLIALTPFIFWFLTQRRAPLGSSPQRLWSDGDVDVDVDVDVAAVQLSSAPGFHRLLFALPWKPALPLPGSIWPTRMGGMHRSLLALGLASLWLGQVPLPRWSGAEPGGSSWSPAATGGFTESPAWLQGRHIGRSPEQAACWSSNLFFKKEENSCGVRGLPGLLGSSFFISVHMAWESGI